MEDRLLNLYEVSHLVAIKSRWCENQRQQILHEYKMYLMLAATKPRSQAELIRPTQDVDTLWHEHILNTKLYVEYCMNNFGFYLHHISCVPEEYKRELSHHVGRNIQATDPIMFNTSSNANCSPEDHPPNDVSRLANCGAPGPQPD